MIYVGEIGGQCLDLTHLRQMHYHLTVEVLMHWRTEDLELAIIGRDGRGVGKVTVSFILSGQFTIAFPLLFVVVLPLDWLHMSREVKACKGLSGYPGQQNLVLSLKTKCTYCCIP